MLISKNWCCVYSDFDFTFFSFNYFPAASNPIESYRGTARHILKTSISVHSSMLTNKTLLYLYAKHPCLQTWTILHAENLEHPRLPSNCLNLVDFQTDIRHTVMVVAYCSISALSVNNQYPDQWIYIIL